MMRRLEELRNAGEVEAWQKEVESQLCSLFSVFVHEREKREQLEASSQACIGPGAGNPVDVSKTLGASNDAPGNHCTGPAAGGVIRLVEPLLPGSIKMFTGGSNSTPAIEIAPDGRFFVHGRECGMDRDVYEAFRAFLMGTGHLK